MTTIYIVEGNQLDSDDDMNRYDVGWTDNAELADMRAAEMTDASERFHRMVMAVRAEFDQWALANDGTGGQHDDQMRATRLAFYRSDIFAKASAERTAKETELLMKARAEIGDEAWIPGWNVPITYVVIRVGALAKSSRRDA